MFTVYDTICEILSEQLEIPLDEITAESKLRDDLSADSLDLIDLAMTLEDEFRKEVPDEALEKMKNGWRRSSIHRGRVSGIFSGDVKD